jgi:hypothetical protein
MNTTRTEGSKYTGFRSAVDIAKDIRKDIKEEVAAGRLPKDLKVSVRSRYYAGGQSIDINWSSSVATHQVKEVYGRLTLTYSTLGDAIFRKLKSIAEAYNYDNSDATVDYFDTLFYCSPQWDWKVKLKGTNIWGLEPRVAETMLVLFNDGTQLDQALQIAKKLEAQS